MPIGNVPMSDGRVGAQMRGSARVPEPLVRPYDGGLAYKDASMGETRFSHRPDVTGQRHLDDKMAPQLVTDAQPPAIGTRNLHGTTRVGARGRKAEATNPDAPHVAGEIAKHGQSLTVFLAKQSSENPGDVCIGGSARKRFEWGESYGLTSQESQWRGKKMNSVNGRSVYAADQYSYPRKKMFDEPDRTSRKGNAAHLVMLANGGEVEDLGRRHFEKLPSTRIQDSVQGGKKANFKDPYGDLLTAGSQSHPGRPGKMGEYSVFDMIGRKRPDVTGLYGGSENQNCLPATETYGPSHDKEGNVLDYSITENGGPFRRPTLYHNDYRLVKNSTYGEVLPPGHSARWAPGTSESLLKAQQVPPTMNTRNALAESTTIGVAPEISEQPPVRVRFQMIRNART